MGSQPPPVRGGTGHQRLQVGERDLPGGGIGTQPQGSRGGHRLGVGGPRGGQAPGGPGVSVTGAVHLCLIGRVECPAWIGEATASSRAGCMVCLSSQISADLLLGGEGRQVGAVHGLAADASLPTDASAESCDQEMCLVPPTTPLLM